jgi:hypothetical protein
MQQLFCSWVSNTVPPEFESRDNSFPSSVPKDPIDKAPCDEIRRLS